MVQVCPQGLVWRGFQWSRCVPRVWCGGWFSSPGVSPGFGVEEVAMVQVCPQGLVWRGFQWSRCVPRVWCGGGFNGPDVSPEFGVEGGFSDPGFLTPLLQIGAGLGNVGWCLLLCATFIGSCVKPLLHPTCCAVLERNAQPWIPRLRRAVGKLFKLWQNLTARDCVLLTLPVPEAPSSHDTGNMAVVCMEDS